MKKYASINILSCMVMGKSGIGEDYMRNRYASRQVNHQMDTDNHFNLVVSAHYMHSLQRSQKNKYIRKSKKFQT